MALAQDLAGGNRVEFRPIIDNDRAAFQINSVILNRSAHAIIFRIPDHRLFHPSKKFVVHILPHIFQIDIQRTAIRNLPDAVDTGLNGR
jgi:hypothetical protein|tara:strand:- start:312 stop:578 length:267 start_codon:yes stop_codon:yes gene_type:complete